MRQSSLLTALLIVAVSSSADSVRLEGTTYEDVFVQETSKHYLILLPEDGTVLSIAKSALAVGDLELTEDPRTREALRTAWQQKTRARRSDRTTELDPLPQTRDIPEKTWTALPTLYFPPYNEGIREAESFINEQGVRTLILKGTPLDPEHRRARAERQRAVQQAWDEQVRYQQRLARQRLAAQQAAQQAGARYAALAAYEQQQRALNLQRQMLNNEYQRLQNTRLRQRFYAPYYPTVYTTRYGLYGNSFFNIGSTHLSIFSGPGFHTTFVRRAGRPHRPTRPRSGGQDSHYNILKLRDIDHS